MMGCPGAASLAERIDRAVRRASRQRRAVSVGLSRRTGLLDWGCLDGRAYSIRLARWKGPTRLSRPTAAVSPGTKPSDVCLQESKELVTKN